MRLEEQSRWLWEQFPERYLDVAVFVTDLGDVTAVMVLLSVLYWVVDRERSALVVSYIVAGASVVLLLKIGFGLPRPEVELIAREYDRYGFPSGHAFTATVVYGGLLRTFERHRDPALAAGTAALIAAIALSRVVIGVHYLADVIAGVAVGLGFLVAMDRLTDRRPRRGFAVGLVLAGPAVAVAFAAGAETSLAVVGLGAALGGLAGTARLERIPALRSRREGVLLTVLGLGYLLGVSSLESTLGLIHPAVAVGLFAVLTAGILLAPLVLNRAVPDRLVAPDA
ncbi:phosphatase PAP2 family protein [Halovenus sp. WSH3]|uniref:Phosphatase PAP2 family protein n=1 Tax=Halovenus carboxidivorans TaxID=2692199 RepID=A0A6B0T3X3_9EURY|nr:phosphatase PAP2 family protein [Halovenus carboxidivorans]MXR50886.1 phosphatase PAP2 family protein [Halovenus carboxidivorans]